MKRAIWMLAVVFSVVGLANLSHGATITWFNNVGAGYFDSTGAPVGGMMEFGSTPTLSMGALVQLWKAVGGVDDPRMVPAAFEDTNWTVDDVLLGESHIGFGTFAEVDRSFAMTGDYLVNEGDIVYVRAYNVPKPEFPQAPVKEIGIRNDLDEIVTQTVGPVLNPQTLVFDNLRTEPIPEPATLLLLAPGLALWAIRRKK